ncbi:MAG: condensation domain-containing protein, partial [Microcystis sp.]
SFPLQSGEPQILVHDAQDINVLEILDLQELDPQSQAQTVQELIDSDAQYAFDLSKGPLFKAKLLQLNPEKNVLLLNMHHIISDGWSMGVFKNEWEKAYDAFNAGNTPNLAPLPIQYSDYAVWQRHWLTGEVLENQENYWKKQLKDAPKLLDLPTDYPRPAKPSYQGEREDFTLSQGLTEKLKILSQKQGVSLFMTLFSAFSILLSRYSRQEDLCIGTGIANRTHRYTEKSLGFFVNTLILRNQIKSEQSFSELLQKSRQICLDAYANQDIPFEYLVEKLQPERTLTYNPLYQVVIVLQNTERSGKGVNLTGLKIEYLEQTYPFSKVDLLLDLAERD